MFPWPLSKKPKPHPLSLVVIILLTIVFLNLTREWGHTAKTFAAIALAAACGIVGPRVERWVRKKLS